MSQVILPVSVIMPLFNDEQFVGQALTSVNQGKARPAEIIVVDNASSDDSAAFVERLAFENVRVIRNPENVGATRARDQAVAASTQPSLCFLDSDDWLSTDALLAAVERMEATESDICLFQLVKTDMSGDRKLFDLEAPPGPLRGVDALALTLGEWKINATGVYRRCLFDAARRCFHPHGFSDDELLNRRCIGTAVRVSGSTGTYYYRTKPKPYTFDKVVGQTITNIRSTQLAAEFLGPEHAGTRRMRDVVVRNLAGLTARALRGQGGLRRVAALRREYLALAVPWGRENRHARLLDLSLTPILAGA